jgi:hypothetical protein
MYIVGFNGPPESGKDTLAELLAQHMDKMLIGVPVKFESLAMPLRKVAYTLVEWPGNLDGPDYAKFKNTHFGLLGVDGRHLMIDISERFLKPVYGIDVMAKLLLERNEGFPGLMLVRDSGFQCEVDPLVAAVGSDNLLIVNVGRPGKSFANDSREWVTHDNRIAVENNGTIDDLRVDASRVFAKMIQLGWKL